MMNLVYSSSFSPYMACLVFSVMSTFNLDDPGFQSPGATPPAPPLSGSSSSDAATDRRTCLTCHRRMSNKTFDRHSICVACRGSDCDLNHCCEECTEWPEVDLLLYVKHRRTLKSKQSKPKTQAPPPPLPVAPSVPSRQPAPRADLESRLDMLASQVSALSALFQARLAAPQAIDGSLPASQVPGQARLESDARSPHPVKTVGHPQESQALGGSGVEPAEPVTLPCSQAKLGRGVRASAGHNWAPPPSAASQAPLQPWPTPGGVFAPPLSSAAPGVALPLVSDPRLLRSLPSALPVGPLLLFNLRSSHLPLSGLLVSRSLRAAIARAAPPLLLMIPRLLSLLSLFMTSALIPSQCLILLLRRGAGLRPGSILHRLRPLLGLTTEFTLGLRRWSPR